ncbi:MULTISPECIES: nucleotidyl transferase AbiEii/AbiGii toxin family protein [unclassified Kitasatospora]|uniref:nucleotidyl transferase AbiEii/AbiGii toxin family protein n=1 Tax=unclassified Kitasatospora TaxID=2633591 RepID=UPI0034479A20
MRLTPLHRRLLADVLAVGAPYQLVLTDGYAVQAHGLADRLSQDLDVATEHPAAMKEIAEALTAGLTERGWQVHEVEVVPLSGRLVVTDPETGESCEVDVLKEHLWKPAVQLEFGPVLRVDVVVGTKMRALADRGYARDLIDVQAAARWFSHRDLEDLGRRHARDTFDLAELRDRLADADWIDDAEFAAYGLDGDAIAGLRTWAQEWVGDLDRRLAAEGDYEDG